VSHLEAADKVRRQNIIDMALMFTAMIRVFEASSKAKIVNRFAVFCKKLPHVKGGQSYETIHREFCTWFVQNVRTASKPLRNKKIKMSTRASYGHGAKVLDIASKVYVHYCGMPDAKTAKIVLPFLHGAIDTPILKDLKKRFPSEAISASTIEGINEDDYETLQQLVARDIREQFEGSILPVQYDDIQWRKLNR
jgi:hypothetical protein